MAILKLPPVPSKAILNEFLAPKEKTVLNTMRKQEHEEIALKKKGRDWQIKGKKYLTKNISNEIEKQKEKGISSVVKTHINALGKSTNASITEDLG